jgi:sec-independent protein translocase protein TatC
VVGNIASPPQTFYDHIQELRKRLTWSVLAFLIGCTAGYLAHRRLVVFLTKPLHESLYFTSPAGSFNFIMKISFLVGLAFALPIIVYNITAFIHPAFPKQLTKKVIRRITLLSFTLAIAGAAFGFFVVIPMSLHFFLGFATDGLKPLISANDYLTFVINSLISFVLIFQTPLIVLFIDRIKPMPPKKLLKWEKFVIVGSLGLAVILPFTYDPLTQFLLAIPIVILYNLSIVLILIAHHRTQKAKRKQATHKVLQPVHTHAEPKPKPEIEKPIVHHKPVPVLQSTPVTVARVRVTEPTYTSRTIIETPRRTRSMDGLSRPVSSNFLDLRKPKTESA